MQVYTCAFACWSIIAENNRFVNKVCEFFTDYTKIMRCFCAEKRMSLNGRLVRIFEYKYVQVTYGEETKIFI